MTQTRLKKSDTIEIRLPHQTKAAFATLCQSQGRTVSDAVRGYIDQSVTPRRGLRLDHLALALAAAAVVGAAAAPVLARPSIDGQFRALDRDGDHAVAPAEFLRLDRDGDGAVSATEFRSAR